MNESDKKSVAIVLVNFNGFEDTAECIKSLKKIDYTNYTIIVVDNGSTKGCTEELKQYIEQNSEYLALSENLGFSGGNNVGIRKAIQEKYDYILLLNNDTAVEPEFLSVLVEEYESNSRVGICTCKTMYYTQPEVTWYCGGEFDKELGLCRHFRDSENGKSSENRLVTFASGCIMLMSSEAIRNVGEMSEDYFLYCEDTDYCARFLQAGYNILYTPKTRIYHKVSKSTGNKSPLNQYYYVRNSLYVIQRYADKKFNGYTKYLYSRYKDVIRGRLVLKYVNMGFRDFRKGITGKVEYFS